MSNPFSSSISTQPKRSQHKGQSNASFKTINITFRDITTYFTIFCLSYRSIKLNTKKYTYTRDLHMRNLRYETEKKNPHIIRIGCWDAKTRKKGPRSGGGKSKDNTQDTATRRPRYYRLLAWEWKNLLLDLALDFRSARVSALPVLTELSRLIYLYSISPLIIFLLLLLFLALIVIVIIIVIHLLTIIHLAL